MSLLFQRNSCEKLFFSQHIRKYHPNINIQHWSISYIGGLVKLLRNGSTFQDIIFQFVFKILSHVLDTSSGRRDNWKLLERIHDIRFIFKVSTAASTNSSFTTVRASKYFLWFARIRVILKDAIVSVFDCLTTQLSNLLRFAFSAHSLLENRFHSFYARISKFLHLVYAVRVHIITETCIFYHRIF